MGRLRVRQARDTSEARTRVGRAWPLWRPGSDLGMGCPRCPRGAGLVAEVQHGAAGHPACCGVRSRGVPPEAGVGLCLTLGFGWEDADALEVFGLCEGQNFNRGRFSLSLNHNFSSTADAFRLFQRVLGKSWPLAGSSGKKG